MSRQKTSGTVPEIRLRRELHARGLRFRVNVRIGRVRPDVVFTRARIAVFVMGDFWHSCPVHATRPKANSGWWDEKLTTNRERDTRQRRDLESDGWLVVWVWECEDPAAAADGIAAAWQQRVATRTRSTD